MEALYVRRNFSFCGRMCLSLNPFIYGQFIILKDVLEMFYNDDSADNISLPALCRLWF